MKNQVQLITYVDRLSGGGIVELAALLRGPLSGLFGGVHLLPFFDPIDGADAGFDPKDHTRVDPRVGGWGDVSALASSFEVTADLIVNHISRDSPQFDDFLARGSASTVADLFLTHERVFPHGATDSDLSAIHRPRPASPFTEVTLANGVRTVRLDAIGYVIKRAGTSCFMIPETFAFIDELSRRVRALGMEVLV